MTEKTTCQWVDDHIEAYLFDDLARDSRQRVDDHARSCTDCAAELASHREIEQLVRAAYRNRLDAAHAPPRSRAVGARSERTRAPGGWLSGGAWIGTATAAGVVLLAGGLLVWAPRSANDPVQSGQVDQPEKADEIPVERAKPEDAEEATPNPSVPTASTDRGEFSLEDPAGYLLSLDDFSGSALVIGVLDEGDVPAFRETYERFRGTDRIRFIAVPSGSGPLPAGVPSMRNRGDSVLSTPPGGFVLVGPDQMVDGRGMTSDPDFAQLIERWIEEDFSFARVE